MAGVFISYRRSETTAWAGRISDQLKAEFGDDHVFLDVRSIELGEDFEVAIEEMLERVDVVIVVIGPTWTSTEDDQGRRLDQPHDRVRLEVADALASDVRVLPVLVDGADMPDDDELPEDLRPLTRLQAIEVTGSGFEAAIGEIERVVRRCMPWWTSRRHRRITLAGVLLLLVAAVGVAVVATSGDSSPDTAEADGEGSQSDPSASASDPSSTTATTSSPTSSTAAAAPSTTEALDTAIAVTAETQGTSIRRNVLGAFPDDAIDAAVAAYRDDFAGFADHARSAGAVPVMYSEFEPLLVVVLVQGTSRMVDEQLSVAVTDLRIEVLDAVPPTSATPVANVLGFTDEPPPIDAKVVLPGAVDEPAQVELLVEDEPVGSLPAFVLRPADTAIIRLEVDAGACTCTWQGTIDLLIAGERVSVPILDADGRPFVMSGRANAADLVNPSLG